MPNSFNLNLKRKIQTRCVFPGNYIYIYMTHGQKTLSHLEILTAWKTEGSAAENDRCSLPCCDRIFI